MTIIDGKFIPPKRIQRRRVKGWRKPAGNVINCARPSKYGNPHPIDKPCVLCWYQTHDRKESLIEFKHYAVARTHCDPHWLDDLRAADYAMCYCNEHEKCHVDILIELL